MKLLAIVSALSGLSFTTHASNAIPELTPEQIAMADEHIVQLLKGAFSMFDADSDGEFLMLCMYTASVMIILSYFVPCIETSFRCFNRRNYRRRDDYFLEIYGKGLD